MAHAFLGLGGEEAGLVERRLKRRPFCTVSGGYRFVHDDLPLLRRGDYFFGYSHQPSYRVRLPELTFTFTILRDPAERVISLYRYLADPRADEGQAFEAPDHERGWARKGFGNFLACLPVRDLRNQLYTFSGSGSVPEAAERILACDLIMRTESLDHGIGKMAKYLGVPLTAQRTRQSIFDFRPTGAERERLRELLEPEYQLLTLLNSAGRALL